MMQRARRVRKRINGRVVLIHGIMGGKLATIDRSGDEDIVWVNILRLAAGRIGDFALDASQSLDRNPGRNGSQIQPRNVVLEGRPGIEQIAVARDRGRVRPEPRANDNADRDERAEQCRQPNLSRFQRQRAFTITAFAG